MATGLRLSERSQLRKQSGYLLLEVLCSLQLAAAALLVLLRTTSGGVESLVRVREQLLLENARRHITWQLEKTLALDAVKITIQGQKIKCVSLLGNKSYLIYCEKQKLLQKTTTGTGSGVNPLSLEEVQVRDWRVEALTGRDAVVSFTLSRGRQKLAVRQRLHCYNAEVVSNE